MRFILSFVLFTTFGFAQQNCHKATTQTATANKTEAVGKANASSNTIAAAPSSAAFPEEAPRISLEDAKKAFDAGDVVFVDTRAAAAYKTEHIKGAINIPAGEFEKRYAEVPKGKKIIAYCS